MLSSGATDVRACPPPATLESFALNGASDAALESHMGGCPACAAMVEEIRENRRFLDNAAPILRAALECGAISGNDQSPAAVPGYELIEEIGRGGQGVVYRALQISTQRPVAVKFLLGGNLALPRQLARFEREIELAARLRHPCTVTVFESGCTPAGDRYVSMEYIDGLPIDRYVRAHAASPPGSRAWTDWVVRLFVAIADGVGYAHERGVIHRDLKPSNILVDAQQQPRVLDFGLARPVIAHTDGEQAATTREFVGTPAFAAPEQLSRPTDTATTASDVYALAVTLYVALTGQHPYPCDGPLVEVARHVCSTPPTPPSRHLPRIPRDLETVILRGLDKVPTRRYANARDFGADLSSYLRGDPIAARRDSTLYVLWRLASRHRVPASAAAILLATVLLATIGLSLLARDLDQARRDAEAALSESTVRRGRLMAKTGDALRAESLLWREAFRAGLRADDRACFTGEPQALRSAWSLAEYYSRVPKRFSAALTAPAVALWIESNAVCALDQEGVRWTWSLAGQLLERTPPRWPRVSDALFVASERGGFIAAWDENTLTVHDLERGETHARALRRDRWTLSALSEDGRWLAAVAPRENGDLLIVDTRGAGPPLRFPDQATGANFDIAPRSGALLVGTGQGPGLQVFVRAGPQWDIVERIGAPQVAVRGKIAVRHQKRTSDGRFVAASAGGTLVLIDTETRESQMRYLSAAIVSLQFADADRALVTSTFDGVIRRHRLPDLAPSVEVPMFMVGSTAAASADAALLAARAHSQVCLFDGQARPWLERISASDSTLAGLAVAPDGLLACGDGSGTLHLLSRASPSRITVRAHSTEINAVAFSPDAAEIATGGADGLIRLWNRDGTPVRTVAALPGRVWSVEYSPNGRMLAAGADGGLIGIWALDGEPAERWIRCRADRVPSVSFSPQGRWLAAATLADGPAADRDGAVVCEVDSGRLVQRFSAHNQWVRAVAWSADGRRLATGGDDRSVEIWESGTWRRLHRIEGIPWSVFDLQFHPAGRVLWVAGRGGELLVLDPEAGTEISTLEVNQSSIFSLAATPDGMTLFTGGEDPGIGVVHLDRLQHYIRGNEDYWRRQLAEAALAEPR